MYKVNKTSTLFHSVCIQRQVPSRVLLIFCLLSAIVINAVLPSVTLAENYYLDAVNGDDSSPGNINEPWQTLDKAFSSLQSGDTAFLKSGYYGEINISNTNNSDYITIAAQPGHTPGVRSIRLTDSSRWIFRGLTISPELAPTYNATYLFDIIGSSQYITLEDSNLYYTLDSSGWTATDWTSRPAQFAIRLWSGSHITIRNNTLKNVRFGISITTPNVLVEYNTIENIAADGITVNSDNITVQFNTIKNFYKVDGNHDDAIQSWSTTAGEVHENNIIRGNFIVSKDIGVTNPLVGSPMGINGSSAGGHYRGWLVENNVVLVQHIWGIYLSEITDSTIVNNIVFDPTGNNRTQINFGPGGSNCIVRNNIALAYGLWGTNHTVSHNIDIDDYGPDALFADWRNFDMSHISTSPAIDAGTSQDAPNIDISGTSRPQGAAFDIGAYEFVPSGSQAPVANAGLDQTITDSDNNGSEQVNLDGSGSSDPDGTIESYSWSEGGNQIATGDSPEVTLSVGMHTITLTVTDNDDLTDTDNVVITVEGPDVTAPSIVSVSASETSVEITFSEPLDATSAEQTSNYSINNGVSVIAAVLDNDSVTLTTTAHTEGFYTLTVKNVQDAKGNQISEITRNYEYDNGLVAHWKFDDVSGNSAMDSSGNNNTGILINGPTWTTGKINGALKFDGTNQYVEIGAQDIAGPWTASLWVERQDSSNSNAALLESANYSLKLEQYPNLNNMGFSIYGVDDYIFNYEAPIGNWAHLVFVGTQTQVSLYVDGVLEDSIAASISCPMAQLSSASRAVNGTIDEVRVYNRALNASEILGLYNEGTTPDTTAPVISSVQTSNVTTLQATMTWSTNENSTSQVEYGLSTSYGNTTNVDPNLVTSHSVLLTGLASETLYHYRVRSEDASGNESISQDNTFTTLGTTTYSITTSAGSGGTISPSGITQVASGGSQVYTITANSGYHISDVIVDGSSVGVLSSYTFSNVTTNHTITAAFAINTYTITANTSSDGTISPSGTTQVAYGGSQAYTITANSGYHISDVIVDGSSVGVLNSYTFSNVTTNHTITATFAINTYTITATAGNGGQINPIGTTQVTSGDSQAYTITADPGYKISNVLVDGSSVGAVTSYSFTNVTANHTIAASFAIDEIDVTVPTVTNLSPQADSIQAQLNTLITLDITDSGDGVDANSVTIKVSNDTVYSGNTDKYSSAYGECYRTGTKADYTFIYQSKEKFNFDQTISVKVNASDLAGNSMDEYSYYFKTKMRAFGKNKKVNKDNNFSTDSAEFASIVNNNRPKTCCDSKGNIWATWHAGPTSNKDIYINKLTAGSEVFGDSIKLTDNPADQRNPTIAVGNGDKLYIAWQDNGRGNWDIYLSTSSDGINFSTEIRVTDSNDNQINPAIVLDSSNNAYIVWEDDRNDNKDIYVASSNNDFVTKTVSQITLDNSNQVEPAIAADSDNKVYVVWTDTRNSNNDIYGAASNNGPWTNIPIVNTGDSQTSPAIATEDVGSILHIVWVDDRLGNNDIFYDKTTGGLAPLNGNSIIDDTKGTDQRRPTIAVSGSTGNNLQVFVSWEDERNTDYDLYFAELGSGSGTNVFVGDDETNSGQTEPALGIDRDGDPYLVWTDSRNMNTDIYYAGSTSIEATALASGNISTSSTTTVETADGVSVVVPAGAYPCDIEITISEVKNPPSTSKEYLSLPYDFGPSGIEFDLPVTITIPYEVPASGYSVSAYWYNLLTASPSQQGITDIETIVISSTTYLRFKTTHFTQFFVGGSFGSNSVSVSGGGGGGGCSMSASSQASALELLLPYIGLTVTMVVLKLKDGRKRKTHNITENRH